MGLSIDEMEAMHAPPKHSGLIPLREVREVKVQDLTPSQPLRPASNWKCAIRHFDGKCTCSPPLIHRPHMVETAEASGRYVLGALHKTPVAGQLTKEDLDFLAWSCSKMAAHWGRLALGQEYLL